MLSLASNPYDPFDEYEKWKLFDTLEGFDTDGLLARVVSPLSDLSEWWEERAIEEAVDSIIANPSFAGLYKKVIRPD